MGIYPERYARCQHIKVNGTQCGSPALRGEEHCYFHRAWRQRRVEMLRRNSEGEAVALPVLEDANSIQMALTQVAQLVMLDEIDPKRAGMLLYALQTASSNLRQCTLEPALPTTVVIDQEAVARRPIGATAWSSKEGREYDAVPRERKWEDDEEPENTLAATLLERLGLPSDLPRSRDEDDC
jgi:hypothetical protein